MFFTASWRIILQTDFQLFCSYCIIYCNSHFSNILKIETWDLTGTVVPVLMILSAHKNCEKSVLHLNFEEILMSKEVVELPGRSLETG